MNFEIAFSLINLLVIPGWILLLFVPNWKWTGRIVHSVLIPALLSITYAYFIIWGMFFGGAVEGAGMGSLAEVMALFTSPVSMLAGWTHYLVVDLFVGAWIVRDGTRRGVGALWRVPCLLLTFMFGPLGLGLYLLLRRLLGKGSWSLAET
jgi:hypothetical protein